MQYLTNYYKNLSEHLQEQVNYLENLILEYRKTSTQRVDIHDIERGGEDVPLIHGRIVTKKGNLAGKGAAKQRDVGFYPGMGAMPNYVGHDEADAWEAISDTGRPTIEDNPIYANFMAKGPAQDVLRGEIFDIERRKRGHSVPGTGKKAAKKKQAIAREEYRKKYGR